MLRALGAAYAWHERGARQTAELIRNGYVATAVAAATLSRFYEYSNRLLTAARAPELLALAESNHAGIAILPQLEKITDRHDSTIVLGTDGRVIARWPEPVTNLHGRTFSFRDYFIGARELAERVTDFTTNGPRRVRSI